MQRSEGKDGITFKGERISQVFHSGTKIKKSQVKVNFSKQPRAKSEIP
jgi:hypothetical protein